MERYALIGFPISHSLSPRLFTSAYDGKYPYDLIETDSFDEAFSRFIDGPYRAINVTAPFKQLAMEAADWRSPEVERIGAANILVKDTSRKGAHGPFVSAYNSDYLGVLEILKKVRPTLADDATAIVIGFGGAGKAAKAAAEDAGFATRVLRHSEIGGGAEADLIIFTLPKAAPGCELLRSKVLLEANYKDPCMQSHEGYISGLEWIVAQAETGYEIMTGEPVFHSPVLK